MHSFDARIGGRDPVACMPCRSARDRSPWSFLAPILAVCVLQAVAMSGMAQSLPTRCPVVEPDPAAPPPVELVESIRRHVRSGIPCRVNGSIRVLASWVGDRLALRGERRDSLGDVVFAYRGECPAADSDLDACCVAWVGDFAHAQDAVLTRIADRNSRTPDWARVAFLASVTGSIGFRASFFTLKWDYAYLTLTQTSCIFGLREDPFESFYLSAGVEGGYRTQFGPHWISMGLQVAFGVQLGGTNTAEPAYDDDLDGVIGFALSPTFRYRHYWERFGLEASLEWPLVFGNDGTATPWPILGLGVGF